MTAEPVLSIRGLSKSYGRVAAVTDIDLAVNAGEFVALLGPNGAGKTTLFQMLTGLFLPDAGTAMVAGHDIRRDPVAALSRIGIVFQQPTLDLEMTVIGNLRLHARLHGLRRAERERRIAEALSTIELDGSPLRPARQLSGGNRRRVELARALLHDPVLLLMDEPTVGLDPSSRRDLLRRVEDLRRRRGLGVLWATHLVDEAEQANRVIVMERGRIVADAAPEGLLSATGSTTLSDAFLSLTALSPEALAQSTAR